MDGNLLGSLVRSLPVQDSDVHAQQLRGCTHGLHVARAARSMDFSQWCLRSWVVAGKAKDGARLQPEA
jgi:hypothetical protein